MIAQLHSCYMKAATKTQASPKARTISVFHILCSGLLAKGTFEKGSPLLFKWIWDGGRAE